MMAMVGPHKEILNEKELIEVRKNGGKIIQIFVSYSTSSSKLLYDLRKIHDLINKTELRIVVHSNYRINLAGPWTPDSWHVKLLIEEVKWSSMIGSFGVVVHIGARKEQTIEDAQNNFISSILHVLKITESSPSNILLETPAGQGTVIEYSLEGLAKINQRIVDVFPKKYSQRVKWCIDVCHIFAAGYDISKKKNGVKYLKMFDDLIGLDKLRLFHFSDNFFPLGSRRDRHMSIGEGEIGIDGYVPFIDCAKKLRIPIILETPSKYHKRELKLVSKLLEHS
jgi:deoxyribonuclease IV